MEKIAKQQYEEKNEESIRKRKQNYYQAKNQDNSNLKTFLSNSSDKDQLIYSFLLSFFFFA